MKQLQHAAPKSFSSSVPYWKNYGQVCYNSLYSYMEDVGDDDDDNDDDDEEITIKEMATDNNYFYGV